MDDRAAALVLAMELRESMNKFLRSRVSCGAPEIEFRFSDVSQLQSERREFVANVSVRFTDEVSA